MKFYFGKMKYFHFGVWWVSYNCLHVTVYKLVAGVISLLSWQYWTFISGDEMSCKTWKSFNRNHLHMLLYHQERMIGFYWMGRFSRTTPRTKFHFISPTMKSNVNRISFMAGRNFNSGMFHFGSHVNTKSTEWFKSHNLFLLC